MFWKTSYFFPLNVSRERTAEEEEVIDEDMNSKDQRGKRVRTVKLKIAPNEVLNQILYENHDSVKFEILCSHLFSAVIFMWSEGRVNELNEEVWDCCLLHRVI